MELGGGGELNIQLAIEKSDQGPGEKVQVSGMAGKSLVSER